MSIIFALILFIVCEYCKSKNIIRKGFRYNKTGKKQKHFCHSCKRWFVEDDGFKRMRFKPKIIVRAVHQYEEGMSLSKVKNHLNQHDYTKVTRWAILKWVKKYSDFLKKLLPNIKPKIKGRIHVDEKEVNVNGKMGYDLNAIDSKTKFDIAEKYVKKRIEKAFAGSCSPSGQRPEELFGLEKEGLWLII